MKIAEKNKERTIIYSITSMVKSENAASLSARMANDIITKRNAATANEVTSQFFIW